MRTRLAETAAILLVGDGVIGALFPRRHTARWTEGPSLWRRAMEPFQESPGMTRAAALLEIVVGLWWAAKLPARR